MEDSMKWAGFNEEGKIIFTETPNPWITDKAVQDRRSKNRFHEHSSDGCQLVLKSEEAVVTAYPDHKLYTCLCGWLGWLIPPPTN